MKELAKIIFQFELMRKQFYIGSLDTKFLKNLYSTFVSFLPRKKINYKLIKKTDKRGHFLEFLKTKNSGQFSIFVAKK